MNLLDFFLNDPQNYHLVGQGGSGKTSSLCYVNKSLLDKEYKTVDSDGRCQRLLPIYIKMSQYNLMKVDFYPIQSFIASEYFEHTDSKAVNKMFKEKKVLVK